jgi:carbon storage regulator
MLVLSRQRDETIVYGGLDESGRHTLFDKFGNPVIIEVTTVDIRGDKTRQGTTAPRTVPVHRKEVYEAIQRERQAQEARKPVGC